MRRGGARPRSAWTARINQSGRRAIWSSVLATSSASHKWGCLGTRFAPRELLHVVKGVHGVGTDRKTIVRPRSRRSRQTKRKRSAGSAGGPHVSVEFGFVHHRHEAFRLQHLAESISAAFWKANVGRAAHVQRSSGASRVGFSFCEDCALFSRMKGAREHMWEENRARETHRNQSGYMVYRLRCWGKKANEVLEGEERTELDDFVGSECMFSVSIR